MARMRVLLCVLLSFLLVLGCGGSSTGSKTAEARADQDIVRYRLPLRGNSVSPREASLCYGGCQSESSPGEYLDCLAECPGFEVTPGAPCGPRDVPVYAAAGAVVPRDRGRFADALLRAMPGLPVEDEERLRDPEVLHAFLERVRAFHRASRDPR